MGVKENILIGEITQLINEYFEYNERFYNKPGHDKSAFFMELSRQEFYTFNEEALFEIKDCVDKMPTDFIDFIFDLKNSHDSTVTLIDAINFQKDNKTFMRDKFYFIDINFERNLQPLLGEDSKPGTLLYIGLNDSYQDFYNALSIRELLYLTKNYPTFPLFDEILFKLYLYKILNKELSLKNIEMTFETIIKIMKIIEEYDASIPFDWFIEFKNEDLNELFKILLKDETSYLYFHQV